MASGGKSPQRGLAQQPCIAVPAVVPRFEGETGRPQPGKSGTWTQARNLLRKCVLKRSTTPFRHGS